MVYGMGVPGCSSERDGMLRSGCEDCEMKLNIRLVELVGTDLGWRTFNVKVEGGSRIY